MDSERVVRRWRLFARQSLIHTSGISLRFPLRMCMHTRTHAPPESPDRPFAPRHGYGVYYNSSIHVHNGPKYCPGVVGHEAGSIHAHNTCIHTSMGLYSQFRSETLACGHASALSHMQGSHSTAQACPKHPACPQPSPVHHLASFSQYPGRQPSCTRRTCTRRTPLPRTRPRAPEPNTSACREPLALRQPQQGSGGPPDGTAAHTGP